jgi:hydrogenase maturation protease
LEACVIGAGNRWRKDDGIGLVVAGKLKILVSRENADVFYIEERLFELQSYFNRYKKVVLIDALPPKTEPGKIKIRRMNGSDISLRSRLPQRTHNAYSLHDLDLLWQIQSAFRNGYQGELMLIGIEAGTLGYGEGLSLQLAMVLPIVLLKLEQSILEFLKVQ